MLGKLETNPASGSPEGNSLRKETMYVTAKAVVSCAHFKAGEFVGVKFYGFDDEGQAWYLIDRSQNGPLSQVVAYPAKHLTQFCL